jgi:hypothetical protein
MSSPVFTFYEVSVPLWMRGLTALANMLTKAEAHAKEKGLDADSYVTAKLSEDMLPLSFQVQVASNTAKNSLWRMTGTKFADWEDNERTMAELQARVQKTLDLLKSIKPTDLDGRQDNEVELRMGSQGTLQLSARQYCFSYGLPNFFFHLNMAYAILRAQGVSLGKQDYLGSFFDKKSSA